MDEVSVEEIAAPGFDDPHSAYKEKTLASADRNRNNSYDNDNKDNNRSSEEDDGSAAVQYYPILGQSFLILISVVMVMAH